MKKVSLNVLNFNTYDKTKKCIDSCLRQNGNNYGVLLIDNCSTDDSFEKLKLLYGDAIDYLQTGSNYGYARGNNIGIQYCYNQGVKYTFILNSDTELVGDNLVDELLYVAENHKDYAIVAPLLFDVTDSGLILNKNDSCYFKALRVCGILPPRRIVSENIELISYSHGAAFLVDNESFIKAGGFPEHYFMYCEESTLTKKLLWNNKYICWYKNENNYVLHHHDTTRGYAPWREFLQGRNLGLEYYHYRKLHNSFMWSIVYLFFKYWLRCRNKYNLYNGMEEARYIYKNNESLDECFKKAVEIRYNYKG